jgi:hypothetical protein
MKKESYLSFDAGHIYMKRYGYIDNLRTPQ